MPRVLAAAIDHAHVTGLLTSSQFMGTLFMLCAAAAMFAAVVFACGHRSKKRSHIHKQSQNVAYLSGGAGGGAGGCGGGGVGCGGVGGSGGGCGGGGGVGGGGGGGGGGGVGGGGGGC